MKVFVALVLVGLCACPLWAIAPKTPPGPAAPATLSHDNLRWFKLNGKELVAGGQCANLLQDAQTHLGRQLTQEEIERNLPAIINATGEQLVEPPRSTSGWNCFTSEMTLTTPRGPRKMRELKVGDEVISIDLIHSVPVINRIQGLRAVNAQKFDLLPDLASPIEVTAEHRFLSYGEGLNLDYHQIGHLTDESRLIRISQGACETVPRGRYLENVGVGKVYDISLEAEPRNFIVEGVLVHNVKL